MRALSTLNQAMRRSNRTAALAIALLGSTSAFAQTAPAPATEAEAEQESEDIVVTGSLIDRAGFDQPTPTTVIGATELRQGARANIAQVLNDQPAFRPTVSPTVSVGNTSSGTAPVDLRGLGTARTLTLLNGRRFVGDNNLNLIPSGLVERVEVVTGGASAAYGSGAVAGVVNIILSDDLEGISLGASGGVSSRGDAQRYSFNGTFGTHFAGDRGHFMAGVEYVDDLGVKDRNTRPNLGSTGIVPVNPAAPTGPSVLVQDVNYTNRSAGGLITSGLFAGQTFNSDGTLRPFRGPNAQGIGGADGLGLYDDVYASSPFERINGYARASFDLGGAKVWIDGTYGRAKSNYPFFPDLLLSSQSISATNPYLRPEYRQALANAGQANITVGRVFNDIFLNDFNLFRENKEGAIGIDGDFGGGWKYNAYYSHGVVETRESATNSRIAANYTRAVNAVMNSAGQIVCAVNADTITTNDDAACAPLNILGNGVASQASLDYVRGAQSQRSISKLDAVGAQVQGDLFPLPGGPLTVAAGGEIRWESVDTRRDPLTATAGYFGFALYAQDLQGEFEVKEGFVEVAAPVLDFENSFKLDLSGAARYSDYSFSGGIWSWKIGGTARIANDILLRATRSRDIRAPGIGNLFSTRNTNIGSLNDRDRAPYLSTPGYNPQPLEVFTYSGGNPDLVPEIGKTLTLGGSITPSFFSGFSLSVDYYSIKIEQAITTLSGSSLTLACANGNQAACARVVRDSTGTVTTVFSNAQNIASFETKGVDIEASYVLPMSRLNSDMGGSLRVRALATYVDEFITNDGTTPIDRAGDVGNTVAGVPHWRGTLSFDYQDEVVGFDARVRYVGGGTFDSQNVLLTNNSVDSRTYVDVGAQFKVAESYTFSLNVNNLFDVDPPLSTAGPVHYDAIGTYITAGVRVAF